MLIYRSVFGDFEIDINKLGPVVNVLIKKRVSRDREQNIFHYELPGGSQTILDVICL